MILTDNEEGRSYASTVVRQGGVIGFLTDTFYGLGVDPLNEDALIRLRNLKGREAQKPILLLISDRQIVDRFIVERSAIFDELAEIHWPGLITLVGNAKPTLSKALTAGTETIGLRLPASTAVCGLVDACGGALTATSANPSGAPPAREAHDVESYFSQRLDVIVDGGKAETSQPSTVLDLSQPEPRLIREGIVKRSVLEESLERFGLHLK